MYTETEHKNGTSCPDFTFKNITFYGNLKFHPPSLCIFLTSLGCAHNNERGPTRIKLMSGKGNDHPILFDKLFNRMFINVQIIIIL